MSGSRQSISSRFQISGDSGKPLHNNNGMASPSLGNDSVLRVVGSSHSGHVCHIPQHSAPPVHVSSTGATNIGSGCSITTLAGTVIVQVFSVSVAEQGNSETSSHSKRRDHFDPPWWSSQPWFPHLIQICVDQFRFLPFCQNLISEPGHISDGSRTIYMQGGSFKALSSSRIFRRGL